MAFVDCFIGTIMDFDHSFECGCVLIHQCFGPHGPIKFGASGILEDMQPSLSGLWRQIYGAADPQWDQEHPSEQISKSEFEVSGLDGDHADETDMVRMLF